MKLRAYLPNTSIIEALEHEIERHLDTSRPVVQYIRRSTENQKNYNLMSLVQQDIRMGEKLIGKGFTHVEKIDTDDGTSGQRLLEDRAGLQYVYDLLEGRKLIDNQRVAAIAAYDASRMWRDTTHVWYNDFIQKLIANDVPFITWRRTYWPQDANDMEALREEFKAALASLKTITERANPARLEAVNNGSYGGHAIPPGYYIVGTKTDRHYAVYEEHRALVLYLFERFKFWNGSRSKLLHELIETGFHFPEFTIENPPHLALPHIKGVGYFVRTERALTSILTNRAYLGEYYFTTYEAAEYRYDEKKGRRVRGKGTPKASYVNKQAHEPIVPRDLFAWCYEHVTGETLDGVQVEQRPERRYGVQTNALLEGLLESDGNPVYCMAYKNTYVARKYLDGYGWISTELNVPIADVDKVFGMVMDSLVAVDRLQGDGAISKRIAEVRRDIVEHVTDYQAKLAVLENAKRGWNLDKQSAREKGYKPGLDEANEQLAKIDSQIAAITDEMNRADKKDQELAECSMLFCQLLRGWTGMAFKYQRRLAQLLVTHANITEATPHIIKLVVSFGVPVSKTKAIYFYRAQGSRPAWTEQENTILRQLYPVADRAEVLAALPDRTWKSCIMQARSKPLSLERTTRLNTSDISEYMAYADCELIRELGMQPNDAYWPQVRDITLLVQESELMSKNEVIH